MSRVFSGARIDAVVHLAGLKSVAESVAQPLRYYQANIGSTLVLLDAMRAHDVRKLVFSSSATVYGVPEELPIRESARVGYDLANPYGRTKAMIEQILMDEAAADDRLEVAILRYFNPVGAHESGLMGEDPQSIPNNLMPFVSQVAVGRRAQVVVFGNDYDTPDGTGIRDYIHVMDLAAGHVAALEHMAKGVAVFNLATGRGHSVLEVIEAYSQTIGKPIPFAFVESRTGDIAASFADATKAERELGWVALRTLEDACRDAWRWQTLNPSGYGRVVES